MSRATSRSCRIVAGSAAGLVCATLAAALAAPTAAIPAWLGADGEPLPFEREEEVLDFLATAREVSSEDLATGITRPVKLLLERDGVRAHAVFHSIDRFEQKVKRLPNDRTVMFLKDSYRSQVAAYELSRLLGMGSVPPTVERRAQGRVGSVQLWIENAMTEKKRRERDLTPPDVDRWYQLEADQAAFDNLINNIDRNLGNTLIDGEWNLWLIDHTRSFGHDGSLPYPERLRRISRPLWVALQALTEAEVVDRLGPHLKEIELRALLYRRELMIESLRERIARQGEEAVVFDYGDPWFRVTFEPVD